MSPKILGRNLTVFVNDNEGAIQLANNHLRASGSKHIPV